MIICRPCNQSMISMGDVEVYLQDSYWVQGKQMQCPSCQANIINTNGMTLRHNPDKKFNSNVHFLYEQTTTAQ